MKPIPTGPLRSNYGTWAVSPGQEPMVAAALLALLPRESFDPGFRGQHLATTYFDTANYDLRKARVGKSKYLTLRLRSYRQDGETSLQYALSAKDENGKIRFPIEPADAEAILVGQYFTWPNDLLPASYFARLLELTEDAPLYPTVCVHARRYAVETQEGKGQRFTLDVGVHTNTGKRLPFGVLEFKSDESVPIPSAILALNLNPIKSSKFLWATNTES